MPSSVEGNCTGKLHLARCLERETRTRGESNPQMVERHWLNSIRKLLLAPQNSQNMNWIQPEYILESHLQILMWFCFLVLFRLPSHAISSGLMFRSQLWKCLFTETENSESMETLFHQCLYMTLELHFWQESDLLKESIWLTMICEQNKHNARSEKYICIFIFFISGWKIALQRLWFSTAELPLHSFSKEESPRNCDHSHLHFFCTALCSIVQIIPQLPQIRCWGGERASLSSLFIWQQCSRLGWSTSVIRAIREHRYLDQRVISLFYVTAEPHTSLDYSLHLL